MYGSRCDVGTTVPDVGYPGNLRSTGILMGCIGVLCFSGTVPATRLAAPGLGASTLTFSRIVVAATLGLLVLLLTRRFHWPGFRSLPSLVLMGLGLAVGYPFFLALAVERAPSSHSAVVIGLVPAATAVLSAVRNRERLPARFWVSCAVGVIAVVLFAVGRGGGSLTPADGWLGAAIASCAIGYVEGGRVAQTLGAIPALSWAMLILTPIAAPALLLEGSTHSIASLSASTWAGFAYACVTSMFIGSLAWFRGLATGGTARIGQLNLAQPFLALLWSALLLGEHITISEAATAGVVVICIGICIRSKQRAH